MTTSDNFHTCLICQKPVPDYEPQMCCSGRECGCRGQPTEPCLCSKKCGDALFDVGGPDPRGDYEERRKRHGIPLWKASVIYERDALMEWKLQAERVEAEWDVQAIGKLIGVPLGRSIRATIQPRIEQMIRALELQGEAEEAKRAYLKAKDNPPPGYRGPETDDQYSVYLSDLAGDAHEKVKEAEAAREAILSKVKL